MARSFCLSSFPKLADWFAKHRNSPDPSDAVISLVWSTCRVLECEPRQQLESWLMALENFVNTSSKPQAEFLEAEQILQNAGLDYLEFACELAETGIESNLGGRLLQTFLKCADETELGVFRFLSAWTAFNCGQLEFCIEQCDMVNEPFGCVYTLQGQAVLESGDANGAIECFKVALELTPDDSLASFQLAKAFFSLDRFEDAWKQLDHCERLLPNHPEIDGLRALVALYSKQHPQRPSWLSHAMQRILHLANLDNQNTQLALLGHDLVFELGQIPKLIELYQVLDWEALRNQREFLKAIPHLLRNFERLGWQKQVVQLLNRVAKDEMSATYQPKAMPPTRAKP